MDLSEIINRLESLADPGAVAGMARFGIGGSKVYGIKIPVLRALAKEIGTDRGLAARLWQAGARETRILAAMIDDPALVDETQMESWVLDLDSWEVCDQLCQCLFQDTALAEAKALAWSEREEEFVKRAGFVLMARLAVSRKKEPDENFSPHSADHRRPSLGWAQLCQKGPFLGPAPDRQAFPGPERSGQGDGPGDRGPRHGPGPLAGQGCSQGVGIGEAHGPHQGQGQILINPGRSLDFRGKETRAGKRCFKVPGLKPLGTSGLFWYLCNRICYSRH